MASASTSIPNGGNNKTKRYRSSAKLTKKILEVKEVIQNRSNNDIQIVLEHYDLDVGNTINAFINDDAKEILNNYKLNNNNNNNNNNDLNNVKTNMNNNNNNDNIKNENLELNNKKNIYNKNNKLDKNNNNNNNKKLSNINDLVESIISKYTSTNESTSIVNVEPSSSSTIIPVIQSTSPLFEVRPNILELNNKNNEQNQLEEQINKEPFKSYLIDQKNVININAKKVLEKSQKDLQRQIVSLNKLTTNFDEEIETTQNLLGDLFSKLRSLIDDREAQLKIELNHMKSQGSELFAHRLKKANEFKVIIDQCDYLSDPQIQELKTDIKNFVSERKLDEELGLTKRFSYDFDKAEQTVKTFGQIVKIKTDHYSALNPVMLNDSNSSDNNTPLTTPISTPLLIATPIEAITTTTTTTTTTTRLTPKEMKDIADEIEISLQINGQYNNNHFIDIKKPQRIRNRQNDYNTNPTKVNGVFEQNNRNDVNNFNNNSFNANGTRKQAPKNTKNDISNGDYKHTNGNLNTNGYNKQNGHNGMNGHVKNK